MKTISIIGCGWLGLPLARQLIANGYTVKGSTTTAEKLTLLKAEGIQAHQLKLSPTPEGDLTSLLDADILIVDVPPRAGMYGDDFHPQQMMHLAKAVALSRVGWVIHISSTSIYPELNREVIEDDVTTPDQSAAPALVQAEQSWLAHLPNRRVTILRCGGLLGYDRIPGKYVAGRTVDTGAVPVNYIHRDDAVGLISAVIRQQIAGIFNVVAPEHPTRKEVYIQSCEQFNYLLPKFVESLEEKPYKVVSNQKLTTQLDYTFKYANPLNFFYELKQLET